MSVGYIREFSWVSGIKVQMQGDSVMQGSKEGKYQNMDTVKNDENNYCVGSECLESRVRALQVNEDGNMRAKKLST